MTTWPWVPPTLQSGWGWILGTSWVSTVPPQGLEAVEDGRLLGTVVMDYAAHGAAIFQLARTLGSGEEPGEMENMEDNTIRIPMHIQRADQAFSAIPPETN